MLIWSCSRNADARSSPVAPWKCSRNADARSSPVASWKCSRNADARSSPVDPHALQGSVRLLAVTADSQWLDNVAS